VTFDVGLIGFGEAGSSFALDAGWRDRATAYDRKTDDPAARVGKIADYRKAGIIGTSALSEVVPDAPLLLSLVTADEALTVARSAAALLEPGTLFLDGNSVAPGTKREAARHIEDAGGHYVDMAIMAPVNPARLSVPILLSGPAAKDAGRTLGDLGFDAVRVVGTEIGRASSVKMIRSVMIKGVEALTAECILAASRAGVLDEVLSSLDASEKPKPWRERSDYNLDRMLVHGLRRAAEMEEVASTLDELRLDPAMTRGTIARQRRLGALGIGAPAEGLPAKLALIEDKEHPPT
jgi:3-hydroxyisobutyrate dehydrogenase-like beta-hydroxyacid dehydrogenase